jgi:hypothetical protein
VSDRIAIIEARQVLLLRAGRGEFSRSPAGEFEARWNAIDPTTPAPKAMSVHFLSCECESCVKSYGESVERPTVNPLDGTRLWGDS